MRPLQRTEDLARHFDGDRGDGNRVRTYSGLGARFFGGCKCALQQMFELPGDGPGGAGDGKGFLDLAKNLRLAHDHRVKAGGHAEQMPHRLLVAIFVDVRSEQRGIEAEMADGETPRVDLGESTAASISTRLQVETIMHSRHREWRQGRA